jgi:D-arabinose 1-dehydrogenase-like Zn-dependent alcohol dehydrogenase
MGADEVINLKNIEFSSLKNKFDIVYDTTSTADGFLTAMELTRKELHLKTTNGQVMQGLSHLT